MIIPELPAWDAVLEVVDDVPVTVGDRLRAIYHAAPPRSVNGGPSLHTGLEAVYEHIRTVLARSEGTNLAE